MSNGLLGGIEAGGTKFVLAVGSSPTNIVARHSIPTRKPEDTLAEVAGWFASQGQIDALGIASFGPVDLNRDSPSWGSITNTPKPGWSGCGLASFFAERFGVPIGFDTDVNGAALAEYHFGAGQDASSLAYVTVGTGIGGGLVVNGKALHGVGHPEMGHIFPRRHPKDQAFAGICPHHGDCLEGLACGPAILARWGSSLSELSFDHVAHWVIADYLAQLCHTICATTSAEVIVLGGGVMGTPGLLEKVNARARELDKGYLLGGAKHLLAAPLLGQDSGAVGALLLAKMTSTD